MYMCRFSGRTCYIIFYLEIKITNNYNHGRHDQRNASKSFLFRLQKFPQETRDGLLEGSDDWDLTEILPDCLSTTNKKNTGDLTFSLLDINYKTNKCILYDLRIEYDYKDNEWQFLAEKMLSHPFSQEKWKSELLYCSNCMIWTFCQEFLSYVTYFTSSPVISV